MNVELPDGTVVEDIPDGISRAELATKLTANGMKVPPEWLPKQQGAVSSFLDAVTETGAPVAHALRLGLGHAFGRVMDTVSNLKTGRDDSFYTDAAVADAAEKRQQVKQALAPPKGEERNPVTGFLGSVAGMPQAMATAATGSGGIETATEVLDRGGSGGEAALAGGVSAGVDLAMAAVPLKVGSAIAKKGITSALSNILKGAAGGAAVNVPAGIAGRALKNEALPERDQFADMKQPALSGEAIATDALMAALMGGGAAAHGRAKGTKAKAKQEAEAPGAFPADKFTDLGEGDYRAPNGATVTKDAWEASSPKLREGWMKAAEPEAKLPTGEAKEASVKDFEAALADTSAVDKIKEQHPSGPVAEAAEAVRVQKQKKAEAAAAATKARADAAELRQAAGKTDDGDLKAEFLKRADKLDPPNKIPVGEVKEGQPEVKVKEEKIPVGEAKELPPVDETVPIEKLPVGEATEVHGVEPVDVIPAGEVKELYTDPARAEAQPSGKGEVSEEDSLAAESLRQIEEASPAGYKSAELVDDRVNAEDKAHQAALDARKAGSKAGKVVALKDGKKAELFHMRTKWGFPTIVAMSPDGKPLGQLVFDPTGHESPIVGVEDGARRKGVATAMYDYLHELGAKLPPERAEGHVRTPDGRGFREAYTPPEARGGKVKEVAAPRTEHEDLSDLPAIDESFMRQQERAQERQAPPTAPAVEERGRRHTKTTLEAVKAAHEAEAARLRESDPKAADAAQEAADGASLAGWMLDKNPNLARSLRVEPKAEAGKSLGSYNNVTKIVKLFKGANSHTAAHEVLHHSEAMMPDKVQRGIRREWGRRLDAEMAKATPEVRTALGHAKDMIAGKPGAAENLATAFRDGTLNKTKHYQLTDPSEFWAVNASRILSERHAGRGAWRTEAKQWVREMVERVKGLIGMRSDAPLLKALDRALNPEKTTGARRSATKMLVHGEMNDARKAESSDIATSRRVLPDETKSEKAVRVSMDSLRRITTAQDAAGIPGDKTDIRLAARLNLGKVQHRVEEFTANHLKPLGKLMEQAKKVKLTVQDADDYLMAQHALERNPEIDKINPNAKGGGSGLTDPQAKAILDSFTPAQKVHLDKIADRVYRMHAEKLDAMVDDGLITATSRDAMNAKFKKYVPLKTLDKEADFTGLGRGYQMWANDIKSALGRTTKAGSPIAASIMDATHAIARGERARVDKAIWDFANDPKGADFIRPYYEDKPPSAVMRNEKGSDGQVKRVVDQVELGKHTVPLVIDGEARRVFVPDSLLKEALATAGSPQQVHDYLKAVGKYTRIFNRTLTEWNVAFAPINQIKDVITAGIRAKRLGIDATAFTPEKIVKAQADVFSHIFGKRTGGAAEFQEMIEAGGKTGGYGLTSLEDTMAKLEKMGADVGYADQKGGVLRKLKHAGEFVGEALSDYNSVFEYSTRLAAYKAAKAKGMTTARAAEVARKATVDFNVSGEVGRVLGNVFSFANAALQGLHGDLLDLRSSKTRYRMLSFVALGAAVRVYNELYSGENEETGDKNIDSQADHVLDSNVTLLKPGTREGVKIPLPPGTPSALFAMGGRLARLSMAKPEARDYEREATGILSAVINAALPVRFTEGSNTVTNIGHGLVPTLARPVADISLNANQFGTPIVPETFDKSSPPPSYLHARTTTSPAAVQVSKFLNDATGGDEVTPGKSQKYLGNFVSPEGLEYLVSYYTGGTGQTALQARDIIKKAREGKPQDVNKIPAVRRLAFTEPESYTSRRYEELQKQFQYAVDYDKAQNDDKISSKIAGSLSEFRATDREITGLYKQLRAAGAASEDREPILAEIKQAKARVIKAYNQAE